MALSAVCEAVANRMAMVDGVTQATAIPPPQLGDDRTIVVYPEPGPSTPFAHSGRNNRMVFQNSDQIAVEFHLKANQGDNATFLAVCTPMLDAVRNALWAGFQDGRFDGTVEGMTEIVTNHWGKMGWGKEFTWGFQVLFSVTHGTEVSG